jgi:hypothetical protein
MDHVRKRRLDEIGFAFKPTNNKAKDEKWNLQFKKLRDYYGIHGHCELRRAVDRFIFVLATPHLHSTFRSPCIAVNVPRRYKEDPKLANWVSTQRTCFKNGIMDQVRKTRLDEIGFEFSHKDKVSFVLYVER